MEIRLLSRTSDALAELTDNELLRTVLAGQWGYYGSVPSRSPFAMQVLVVRHFWHGGCYPTGGSGEIATQLLRTVADASSPESAKGDWSAKAEALNLASAHVGLYLVFERDITKAGASSANK